MKLPMQSLVATLAAGGLVALVAAQAVGLFGRDIPSEFTPLPLWLVFLQWCGASALPTVIALAAIFWLWCPSLFQGASAVPNRSYALWFVVATLSAIWSLGGWHYGVRYEGLEYTAFCTLFSVALLCLSAFALWRARTVPSFSNALVFQTLLFLWLASDAFPYLGELP
jgi:hypothetical protein